MTSLRSMVACAADFFCVQGGVHRLPCTGCDEPEAAASAGGGGGPTTAAATLPDGTEATSVAGADFWLTGGISSLSTQHKNVAHCVFVLQK